MAAMLARMELAYLDGTLDVTHRRLGPDGWTTTPGSIVGRSHLGGGANVAVVRVGDEVVGLSLKVLDRSSGTWTAWWVDATTVTLGPPLRGRWSDGVLRFAGVDVDGSLCADVVSSASSEGAAWEQSRSTDGGRTWVPEWTMAMTRSAGADVAGTDGADASPAGDFAFLARELEVEHRRRSRSDFTSTHRGATYLGGSVSVDEVGLPDGQAGMTFRLRSAATGLWSIWWVNGGVGRLEPPVHGRFGPDGIGTFVGSEEDQLVRFTWSEVATARPRWLQELSTDGALTWVRDWEMTFSAGVAS